MTLRITFLAAIIAGIFIQVASGNELDFDSPEGALRHDMSILDAEVRNSALAGYKLRFTLTDDEFSDQLVKLATVATNGEEATLRMFTVAALGDFGTTNALEFLGNEALRGGDVGGGIDGFGAIVGFDECFFALTEQMLADKNITTYRRRAPVYMTFESLLCSDVYRGKPITPAIREKATESLKRHALTDAGNRLLIDSILSKYGPEAQSYRYSLTRLHLAELALADADSSDYERGYFKNVLQQIGSATAKPEENCPPEAATREIGEKTRTELAELMSGRSVEEVDGSTSLETVDADKPSTHTWLYMMIGGVALSALAFLFARWRNSQHKHRNPDNQ